MEGALLEVRGRRESRGGVAKRVGEMNSGGYKGVRGKALGRLGFWEGEGGASLSLAGHL